MTNVELLLNSLAEASATELSRNENPIGFKANANVAKRGGTVAKVARQQLESQLGHSVVSPSTLGNTSERCPTIRHPKQRTLLQR